MMIKGIRVSGVEYSNNSKEMKQQNKNGIKCNHSYASDSFTSNKKVSFGAGAGTQTPPGAKKYANSVKIGPKVGKTRFVRVKDVDFPKEIDNFVKEIDSEYMAKLGSERLETLKNGQDRDTIAGACKALVKDKQFIEIDQFLSKIYPEAPSQRNNSIILDLAHELSKQRMTCLETKAFAKNLLHSPDVLDGAKKIMKTVFIHALKK